MTTPLILHILLTAAALWLWFMSDLPIYLTKWAKQLNVLPAKLPWPDEITMDTWLRNEWIEWVRSQNPTRAHWMECPTCFGTRAAFLSSVWVAFWTQELLVIPFFLIAVPISCTWLAWAKTFKPQS